MKIITKKKAIKYIEEEIESLNSKLFKEELGDDYEAFDYVKTKMDVFYEMGILKKKELDILWNKLVEKVGI